jgi:hypothetical protein
MADVRDAGTHKDVSAIDARLAKEPGSGTRRVMAKDDVGVPAVRVRVDPARTE